MNLRVLSPIWNMLNVFVVFIIPNIQFLLATRIITTYTSWIISTGMFMLMVRMLILHLHGQILTGSIMHIVPTATTVGIGETVGTRLIRITADGDTIHGVIIITADGDIHITDIMDITIMAGALLIITDTDTTTIGEADITMEETTTETILHTTKLTVDQPAMHAHQRKEAAEYRQQQLGVAAAERRPQFAAIIPP